MNGILAALRQAQGERNQRIFGANELMNLLPNNQVLKMLGWFPFHSDS
jgi:hypothetical protein